MERFRELEKGFKKKQFAERADKIDNGGKLKEGTGPICKKRMMQELAVCSDGEEPF